MKLLLREHGSDEAAALWYRATRIASSRVLYVEARATLAVATRQRKIRAKRVLLLREMLESLVDEMHVVDLTPRLAAIAGDVAEAYRLRANDAIHLASALSEPTAGLVMMSWDAELRDAAAGAGLALAPA
jgi:hypothetical protein